jgi:hypothetical protein
MRCMVLGACLALAWGPALVAADDKPDLSPADQVKKITADFDKAQQDFYKEYGEAKTPQERQKLIDEKMPKPAKTAAQLLELAEKNPKDAGVVPDALIWVVTHGSGAGPDSAKNTERALDLLANHVDNPKVGDVCLSLIYNPTSGGEKLMRAIAEKGSNDDAKAKATFSLGQFLKNTAGSIQTLKEQPEMHKAYEDAYGKDVVARMLERDPAAMMKEAEKLFETVGEKYGAVKVYNRPLSESVEGELFEIRNLAIGKTAPDIEGEDLDGSKFKLSEYRGKVVVIDFWGNW